MVAVEPDQTTNTISRSSIEGVRVVDLIENNDARGSFTEVFCDHWDTPIDPTQFSIVRSGAGVLRGMHIHARHDEYISVLSGRAFVGLFDARPDSSTFRVSELHELHTEPRQALVFPRGLLHGWYFPEPTVHLQAVSEEYLFYAEDDNNGCRWDDPALGIEWPGDVHVVSERNEGFSSLDDLIERLRPELRGLVS